MKNSLNLGQCPCTKKISEVEKADYIDEDGYDDAMYLESAACPKLEKYN